MSTWSAGIGTPPSARERRALATEAVQRRPDGFHALVHAADRDHVLPEVRRRRGSPQHGDARRVRLLRRLLTFLHIPLLDGRGAAAAGDRDRRLARCRQRAIATHGSEQRGPDTGRSCIQAEGAAPRSVRRTEVGVPSRIECDGASAFGMVSARARARVGVVRVRVVGRAWPGGRRWRGGWRGRRRAGRCRRGSGRRVLRPRRRRGRGRRAAG